MSKIRAVARMMAILAYGLPIGLAQRFIAGPLFRDYDTTQKIMCRGLSRIMGMKVRFNRLASEDARQGRPVIYASNHMSYMDIVLLGGVLKGAFVSKKEVEKWPLVGFISAAAKTIFIKRTPIFLRTGHGLMAEQLNEGRNIVLFPEGKNTSGDEVTPFRPGMLCVTFSNVSKTPLACRPMVQPLSLRITHVDGEAVKDNPELRRGGYAWWGDRGLGDHFWKLAQTKNIEIEITEHPPLDPYKFTDRREFTRLVHAIVQSRADGPG